MHKQIKFSGELFYFPWEWQQLEVRYKETMPKSTVALHEQKCHGHGMWVALIHSEGW